MRKTFKIIILLICLFLAGCDNTITVKDVAWESLPEKTEYFVGEPLNIDNSKIKITLSDDTTVSLDLEASMITNTDVTSTSGDKEVKISFTYEGNTYALSYLINVSAIEVTNVAWQSEPSKTQYYQDDVLDVSGGKILITLSNDTTEVIDLTDAMITNNDVTSTSGTKTVNISLTYQDNTYDLNYNITVVERVGVFASGDGVISWMINGITDFVLTIDDQVITTSATDLVYDIKDYINILEEKTYAIKLTTGENEYTCEYRHQPKELTVEGLKEKYYFGTSKNEIIDNLTIYLSYNNGYLYELTDYNIDIADYNSNLIGNYQIKISTLENELSKTIDFTLASPVIIYEVYGGGGNNGATYLYDYVVLYNTTNQDFDLSGYSLQYVSRNAYTSVNDYSTNIGVFNIVIEANNYLLVQLASYRTGAGVALPVEASVSFDYINMSASDGKVFLVAGEDAIDTSATGSFVNILDYVGYGTANQYEGAPAPAISVTTAIRRKTFNDTDNNSNDFAALAPNLNYLLDTEEIIAVKTEGLYSMYELGWSFDIGGLTLVIVYNTSKIEYIEVTEEMIVNFDTSTVGKKTLVVSYQEKNYSFDYEVVSELIYDYPYLPSDPDSVQITYIDLGKYGANDTGESTLIKMNNIEILVDAGETYDSTFKAIDEVLTEQVTDGKIEYIIATHAHSDHIGSMPSIINKYDVDTVIRFAPTSYTTTVYNDFVNAYTKKAEDVIFIDDLITEGVRSYSYYLAPSISMTFLNTNSLNSTTDPNYTSLVFVLEAFNTKVLFNGDAESSQESIYAPLAGKVDIMKLGHHGAPNATSLSALRTLNPDVAIVSNGNYLGNKFGHPSSEALANIYTNNSNTKVYAITGGGDSNCTYTLSNTSTNYVLAKAYPSNIVVSNYESITGRFYQRNGSITVTINSENYNITTSRSSYNDNAVIEMRSTDYWKNVLVAVSSRFN